MAFGIPRRCWLTYTNAAADFTAGIVRHVCDSLGLFYLAFVDTCPAGGCPSQPIERNDYFGLYSTMSYLTKGPVVPNNPMPSLVCP